MLLKQNGSSFCPVFNTRWALKCCGGGRRQQLLENCSKDEKDGRGEFEAGAEEEEEGRISICYDTRKERKGKKHGKELNHINFRSVL